MKIYQAFAAALAEHGVETIFGLMGDANMLYLTDYQVNGGRFVPVVHEGSSVGMADAYSRMTGKVGVASVTHGPALTNTLTSLVEGVRSRSQVLVITGDTPLESTHFQQVDIAAVAAAAGAGYEKIYKSKSLVRDLNRALQRAVAERRPIILDLPISMLAADAGEQAAVCAPVPAARSAAHDEALDGALGLIASAKRPIILAGRGAVAAGARDELIALSGRLGAPLATSLLGKDYFVGHPRNIGIFGNLSHGAASTTIGEADCIIAFGASLNIYTSFNGEIMSGKKIVQVEDNPAQFGSFTPVDQAVAGDARLVAAAMNASLKAAGHKPNNRWVENVEQALVAHSPYDDFTDRTAVDTVDIRSAMIKLDEVLPKERTLVSDIGRFVIGVWAHVHVADPKHFTTMGAFGSIGLGMAGSIGAAVACPEQLTVATIGDGGFMMHMAEFTTAVREKLPMLVVILNDGAYGAEHYKLKDFGVDPVYSLTAWPEMVPMAQAMGAQGMTVRKLEELDALADIVKDLDGPFLVDVKLDPDVNTLEH